MKMTASERKQTMNPTKMLPSERHGIPLNSISSAILDAERHPTNAKHTPGKWTTKIRQPGTMLTVENETGEYVCSLLGGDEHKQENARLIAAAPAMLEALRYAAKLIPTARRYFPKSVKFSDRFQLENVCATIGKAISQAEGGAQ